MTRLLPTLTLAALLAAAPGFAGDRVWTGPGPGLGPNAAAVSGPLQQIRFDQNLGQELPFGAAFRDETGRAIRLGELFGQRPVILVLSYYECPMLCPMVLNSLATTLKPLSFEVGRDFDVVVASIDPGETPRLAADAKRRTLERYDRPQSAAGWHFLTGGQDAITALADAAGFRYIYDAEHDQYAHPAGLVLTTPDGRISRYLFGIDYLPRDVRLALMESAGRRIGSPIDNLVLYCFHYDPAIGRYSAATFLILRIAAVATVAGLALLIFLLRRRETRQPVGAA